MVWNRHDKCLHVRWIDVGWIGSCARSECACVCVRVNRAYHRHQLRKIQHHCSLSAHFFPFIHSEAMTRSLPLAYAQYTIQVHLDSLCVLTWTELYTLCSSLLFFYRHSLVQTTNSLLWHRNINNRKATYGIRKMISLFFRPPPFVVAPSIHPSMQSGGRKCGDSDAACWVRIVRYQTCPAIYRTPNNKCVGRFLLNFFCFSFYHSIRRTLPLSISAIDLFFSSSPVWQYDTFSSANSALSDKFMQRMNVSLVDATLATHFRFMGQMACIRHSI